MKEKGPSFPVSRPQFLGAHFFRYVSIKVKNKPPEKKKTLRRLSTN